ncbi:MAG: PEGA domain-containing protein [Bacteroidales bacterium]|nr:PEGA domain-containing protein [Bacteroidales bacterium]
MKRLLTIMSLMLGSIVAFGQISMTVSGKAQLVADDADAVSYFRQTDANDNVCAIIKVTPDNALSSRLVLQTRGGMAPVAPPRGGSNYREDSGEWWFWISPKVTNIMFTCDGYTPTDWIGVSLQPGKVYRLNLDVESSYTIVKQFSGAGLSGIKMTISPEEALVSYGATKDQMINSVPVTDGYFDVSLPEGKYFFKIESEFYETHTTEITVGKGMKEVNVSLKPAFGYLGLSSDPDEAEVWIDGKRVGKTPVARSDRLGKGEHTLLFRKTNYYVVERKVTVKGDGGLQTVPTVTLKPQFGTLVLKCADPKASLVITDPSGKVVFYGTSGSKVNLNSQTTYKLEATRDNYIPQSRAIFGSAIEGATVEIEVDAPVPVYGGLQIATTPSRAEVWLDGEYAGTTLFGQTLLVGNHTVELRKEGYKTQIHSIVIRRDETQSLSFELEATKAAATPATKPTQPKPEEKKPKKPHTRPDFIVGAVVGYDPVFNKVSLGAMAGVAKQFGGYLKYRSDFVSTADVNWNHEYNSSTGLMYFHDSSEVTSAIWTTGAERQHRWVATGGLLLRVLNGFYLYAGGGYGVMNIFWQDYNGSYIIVKDLSRSGATFEVGGMVRIGSFGLSVGGATTNGYMDGEIGIQYYF